MRFKIMGLLLAVVIVTSACMSTNNNEVMADQVKVVKEIQIVSVETPEPTPFPDFDLENLSIVRKEDEENEEKETVHSGDVPGDADDSADTDGETADEGSAGTGGESEGTGEGGAESDGGYNGRADQPVEDEERDHGSEAESGGAEWQYYGSCRITHYDDCEICCGVAGNTTASGVYPTVGHTVASGDDLPFGTEVLIDGQVYVVEDRGVDPGQVDIFVSDHETALQMGMYYTDVYVRYSE